MVCEIKHPLSPLVKFLCRDVRFRPELLFSIMNRFHHVTENRIEHLSSFQVKQGPGLLFGKGAQMENRQTGIHIPWVFILASVCRAVYTTITDHPISPISTSQWIWAATSEAVATRKKHMIVSVLWLFSEMKAQLGTRFVQESSSRSVLFWNVLKNVHFCGFWNILHCCGTLLLLHALRVLCIALVSVRLEYSLHKFITRAPCQDVQILHAQNRKLRRDKIFHSQEWTFLEFQMFFRCWSACFPGCAQKEKWAWAELVFCGRPHPV